MGQNYVVEIKGSEVCHYYLRHQDEEIIRSSLKQVEVEIAGLVKVVTNGEYMDLIRVNNSMIGKIKAPWFKTEFGEGKEVSFADYKSAVEKAL